MRGHRSERVIDELADADAEHRICADHVHSLVEQPDALERRRLGLFACAAPEEQHRQCEDRAEDDSLVAVATDEVRAEDRQDDELAAPRPRQDDARERESDGAAPITAPSHLLRAIAGERERQRA